MKRSVIATLLIIVLALSLVACGKKDTTISTVEAQKIALQELGTTAAEAGHTHVEAAQYEGTACYMVHVTVGGEEHYVYIDQTGKVLHKQ